MKRFLIFLLLLGLALSCLACSDQQSITFYYVREEPAYLFGVENAVIVGETRESASNIQNLHSLLILYFHGPLNETFRSPFPRGTSLVTVQQDGTHLTIRLSSIASAMKGTDLTLACACLARTCFDAVDVEAVTIIATGFGNMSVTMTRDSLLLIDDAVPVPDERY